MLSSVRGMTRDTGEQKTWFTPGDTNNPMRGDQLYLGETRQQNQGCDDSMQIQAEGSGGVSSDNRVLCFYPHCSSPRPFIDVSGEVTGGQNGEGLALGRYLEEAVLSVVIDLDRKMAFLIGRIQNVKVGKLVAPSGQQRR